MRAIIKQPGQPPEIVDDAESKILSNIDGYIEIVKVPQHRDIGIILDDEGKLKGLEPNFYWYNDIIVGPAIFLSVDGEDLVSLTDEQISIVQNYLHANDIIDALNIY